MTDISSFRWGLVGASDIAATRLIPAMRALGQQVSAVSSSAGPHARAFAETHGIAAVHSDLRDMLARDDVDGVYVSSVNEAHHDQVLAAAQAGVHVLCEKPVAVSVPDATEMADACDAAGVVLAVNHHLPAMGTHRMIKDLVAEGAVGRVLSVAIRHTGLLPARLAGWRLDERPGGGVVLDIATHDASTVDAFLGTVPTEVTAIVTAHGERPSSSPDSSLAVLRYGDVLASFHDSFATPFTPSLVEVHGTEGSIRAPEIMTPDPIGEVYLSDSRGERLIEVVDRGNAYERTIRHFVRATRGDGEPIVDGRAGIRALAVAVGIQDSARSGQRVELDVVRPG